MNSVNFEFLRPHQRELADLGGFAERYVHDDPQGALSKLRLMAEAITSSIYARSGFERPYGNQFHDLLTDHQFATAIPKVVCDKLHHLRKAGNDAVHGRSVTNSAAFLALSEAHAVSVWYGISFLKLKREDCPTYCQPTRDTEESKASLKREKKAALKEKEAAEAKMDQLLSELEQARAEAASAQKTESELQNILAQTQQVANALDFDEATTRSKLIDQALIDAGWINIPRSPQRTVHSWIECKVTHLNETIGYADYVLWDEDGSPLAVIEAKKTSEEVSKGRQQARMYAEGLEKEFGRKPVIFCTNGYDWEIWDSEKGDTPRQIWGMYSKGSLQHLHTIQRQPLTPRNPNFDIAGKNRAYQVEAIKSVCQRFDAGFRKALITQATGTGKTRVSIALIDLFLQAGWGKRVLFLCDRRELRKQAYNAFRDFLPHSPAVILNHETVRDTENRVFLATYPAMMKARAQYDVGFFDIIIADESHRSIYNRYKVIFDYFDAFQVGLTATPKGTISHNTYAMFGCENNNPTFSYEYEDAISEVPPILCYYKVIEHTTQFLREGIYYEKLSDAQKAELDEQVENGEAYRFNARVVDKAVFNKETNRIILRNLMENGLRNAANTNIGKTIIFARNHDHAALLGDLFIEMYPKLAGNNFAAVIDNQEPRADQLIDDFKDPLNSLTLAISVDMLDTGVDIPQIVNLVFAKPVQSQVKFKQMIGRGTRLCPEIAKEFFLIFDHWANFQRLENGTITDDETALPKTAQQSRFEDRIELAEAAIAKQDLVAFQIAIEALRADLNDLDEETIAVKEKWRERSRILRGQTLENWRPDTIAMLKSDMAPLMMWRDTQGADAAERFDRLITQTETALLRGSASFANLRDEVVAQVSDLNIALTQVQDKLPLIQEVKSDAFWQGVTVSGLESMRSGLRSVIKHRHSTSGGRKPNPIIDISDGDIKVVERKSHYAANPIEYRKRVQGVLEQIFTECAALQKIKRREPVTDEEIQDLASRVKLYDPDFSYDDLLANFNTKTETKTIAMAIRAIIGLDIEAVNTHFQTFIEGHPELSTYQHRFLALLKQHIAKYGSIEIDHLYDAPFTTLSPEGIEGLFPEDQVDAILDLITALNAA